MATGTATATQSKKNQGHGTIEVNADEYQKFMAAQAKKKQTADKFKRSAAKRYLMLKKAKEQAIEVTEEEIDNYLAAR